jgi:hypothetical protein
LTLTQRRRQELKPGQGKATAADSRRPERLRLVEAVVDPAMPVSTQSLLLHLPGGVRLEMTAPNQVPLVVALVQALQPPATRC